MSALIEAWKDLYRPKHSDVKRESLKARAMSIVKADRERANDGRWVRMPRWICPEGRHGWCVVNRWKGVKPHYRWEVRR